MSDTISKQALQDWKTAEQATIRWQMMNTHDENDQTYLQSKYRLLNKLDDEIKSGRLDIPSNQGEIEILREALDGLMRRLQHDANHNSSHEYNIAAQALSSHTEDKEWKGVLVPESEIEVHHMEDVPDGHPLAEDTVIASSVAFKRRSWEQEDDTGIQKVREAVEAIEGEMIEVYGPKAERIRRRLDCIRSVLGITIPGITDSSDASSEHICGDCKEESNELVSGLCPKCYAAWEEEGCLE